MKRRSLLAAVLLSAAFLSFGSNAPAAVKTTVSFVAHQDDDLLFMNPDIASDVQAGFNVWVVYMTAGEVPHRPGQPYGGIEYANSRIEGERAAYARMANKANDWIYEEMWFGGHPVPTNRLAGTNVRLVFTYIHSAAGPEDNCGDLYRMLQDANFRAQPIDGRPVYTRDSLFGMIRGILHTAQPDYIRGQSTLGHHEGDHIDHTAAGLILAHANLDGQGKTLFRRDEYIGYAIGGYPENVSEYWLSEKKAAWDQYWPKDPALMPWSHAEKVAKQYRPIDRIREPGSSWSAPGDFVDRC